MLPVWCAGAISRVTQLPYRASGNFKKPVEYSITTEPTKRSFQQIYRRIRGVKMRLTIQSFLYCCLLARVAHCVELEVNPELKKRLNTWLGSRLRRDLERVSVDKAQESEHFVRPEDIRDTFLPHSSTDINVRTKRSKTSTNQSRRQGCSLGTCTVHDLAHRLHQLNNKLKIGSAPPIKMSPQGYGRRRRSLPEHRVTLTLAQGRLRPVWSVAASQVHKLEALLRRT